MERKGLETDSIMSPSKIHAWKSTPRMKVLASGTFGRKLGLDESVWIESPLKILVFFDEEEKPELSLSCEDK